MGEIESEVVGGGEGQSVHMEAVKLLLFGPPEDVKMFICVVLKNRAWVGVPCNWPCNVMRVLSEIFLLHTCLIFSGWLGTWPV